MTATNDFLPFSPTDTGTNLLSQANYAIATDRTVGNQPGVASSQLVNKSIRQANVLASQLAQFVCNKTGSDMLDDGNLTNILDALTAAFADPSLSRILSNVGFLPSVATNALTIALKTSDGSTNASSTNPINVGFRNSTASSGSYSVLQVTGSLSIVVPASASLGHTSGLNQYVWVYAINNSGTIELAVSGVALFPDQSIQSTTAITSGSTSGTVLYSTSARTNVVIRLIGRMTVNEVTAGTWASAPIDVISAPQPQPTMTDFAAFTPTFVGWGSPSAINLVSRRIGPNLQVLGTVTPGTPSGSTWSMTLPGSVSTGSSAVLPGTTTVIGSAIRGLTNSGSIDWTIITASSSATVNMGYNNASAASGRGPLVADPGNAVNSGDVISIYFEVPILGWSLYGP